MDSCVKRRDSKDTLVGVKGTREEAIPSRWLIVTVLIGFVLMVFLVARQKMQISTIQLELDNLLHDEIDQVSLINKVCRGVGCFDYY